MSNCWATHCYGIIPSSKPYDGQPTCNRSDNTGDTPAQGSDGRGAHIPRHLSNTALLLWMSTVPGTWNWRTREKLLHIKSPSLLPGYPHIGFHSISIASQQLHTYYLFYCMYANRSVSFVYAVMFKITGVSPWSQCWSVQFLTDYIGEQVDVPSQRRSLAPSLLSPYFYQAEKKCYSVIAVLSSSFSVY